MTGKFGKAVLAVGLAAVMLSGCSAGKGEDLASKKVSEDNKSDSSVDKNESSENKSEELNTDSPETNKIDENALRLVSDATNRESYSTQAGCYYISIDTNKNKKDDGIPSLMYIDYATRKEIYLCNKPNCEHNDDSCQAVMPEELMMGDYYLTGNEEHLYLIMTPSDSAGSMSTAEYVNPEYSSMLTTTSDSPAQIWQMNIDGTNREKLCSLESGTVLSNVYLMDKEYIYAIAKSLKSEKIDDKSTYTASYNSRIIKISQSDGSVSDVVSIDEDDEVLNCYGRNIVVGKLAFTKELSPEEQMDDNKYKDALKSAKYNIKVINIDSGDSKELKTFECKDDYSYVFSNDLMYYSTEKVPGVNCFNMDTGEESQILSDGDYRLESIIDTHLIALDGWLYCDDCYYYTIDINDKTAVKNTLRNDKKNPINIVAEAGDKLLVTYNYKEKKEYVEWAGVTQEVISEVSYGLINKENYYNSKADYEDIDLIGMGLGY